MRNEIGRKKVGCVCQTYTLGNLLVVLEQRIKCNVSGIPSVIQETSDVGKKCFPLKQGNRTGLQETVSHI